MTLRAATVFAACVASVARIGTALAAPGVVNLQITGPEAERAGLEASLREVVGRVGLTVRESAQAPSGGDAIAVVRIDATGADAIHVTVLDARDGHLAAERDVPRSSGGSVAREDTVLVVRSALDALVASARPQPQPQAPAAPAPVTSPVPTKPPSREPLGATFEVGPFVRAATFAADRGLLIGGGIAGELAAWHGPWHPSLTLVAGAHLAQQASMDGVTAQATMATFRGIGSVALFERAGWGIDLGAGIGGDAVFLSVSAGGARAIPPGTNVDPIAIGALGFRAPMGGRVALTGGVSLDADLAPQRFVVDRAGAHDPVYAPLPMRVGVVFGVALRVAGSGAPP